jgi:hypothetical protein
MSQNRNRPANDLFTKAFLNASGRAPMNEPYRSRHSREVAR